MRDLQLWRTLQMPSLLDDANARAELVELLEQVAMLTPRRRAPFLAALAPLTQSDDAAVRAASVAALAGVRGIEGVRRIVAALDDDEAGVRVAAVKALRATAEDAPARWAHAIFHPRADVRGAALAAPAPAQAAHLAIYLRTDPEHAALAAKAPWPARSLPLLFDLFRRGAVDAEEAAQRLSQVESATLRELLNESYQRNQDQIADWLRRAGSEDALPPPSGADILDEWHAIVSRSAEPRIGVHALADAVLADADRRLRRRTVVALTGLGLEALGPEAAMLCAACDPVFLGFRGLPRSLRRAAAIGLGTHRTRVGRIPAHVVDRLLALDLVHGPGGALDLPVAVGIVGLLAHGRIETLTDRFGLDAVVQAILADTAGWQMICQLPDDPKVSPIYLLSLAQAHAPDRWPALAAIALCSWASSASPRYEQLHAGMDARRAGEVLIAILELDQDGSFRAGHPAFSRATRKLLGSIPLGGMRGVLEATLVVGGDEPGAGAVALVAELARSLEAVDFAEQAAGLRADRLARLTRWLDDAIELTISVERALARKLDRHLEPEVAAWATRVLDTRRARPAPPRKTRKDVRRLAVAEAERIAKSPLVELEAALAPALASPSSGLCTALDLRDEPADPHLPACVALLACHDALPEVGRQLERFGGEDEDFANALTSAAITMWLGNPGLAPLGDAWLSDWEQHGFSLLEWTSRVGGLLPALTLALDVSAVIARRALWRGVASMIVLLRYRDSARLAERLEPDLYPFLVDQLDTEVGVFAAKMLAAIHLSGHGGPELAALRDRAFELGPDMQSEARHELERWLRIDGLPRRTTPARRRMLDERPDELARVRTSTDLDLLEKTAAAGRPALVHEATLRLIELGEPGETRLLGLLERDPLPPAAGILVESLPLWQCEAVIERARALARDATGNPEARFRIALALKERGESAWLEIALQAARQPAPEPAPEATPGAAPGAAPARASWFTRRDWDKLTSITPDLRRICLTLADSPHAHAYQKAVAWLLEAGAERPINGALLRFLEAGTDRPTRLRRDAAQKLWLRGEAAVAPVIAEQLTDPDEPTHTWLIERGDAQALADVFVGACLVGGPGVCREQAAVSLLEAASADPGALERRLGRIFTEGLDPVARQRILARLGPIPGRDAKLHAVAGMFAWGVRRGRELTGKLFRVHMTHRREDFGYTKLDQNRVFVSPLAVLQGDKHGQDIVEALILHELGHHMFHAGPQGARIWALAQRRGLFPLLNLVADEHLERNLRALDPDYGDRLKRLAAYGFQHAQRELAVERLVGMLLGASFEALSATALGVAYHEDSVVVHRGHLLRELDRVGHPFARFVRALRMGLGNRHGDPQVEAASALFDKRFRRLDMEGLWQVTLQLAQLFGGAAALARSFGGHEALEWDEREASILGAGLEDDEVQREVERILDPRQKLRPGGDGRPERLAINVIPDASFTPIDRIERIPDDVARHRELVLETRRHTERLRAYLQALGLALMPRRARLRGRAFDRTRARAVVLRRDPRMLVARETEVHNDLFIGVAIDCSGSMSVGDSMVKAQHFAVMLAEAVRPLAGVDARFFGFTDSVIYDAGDDQRCAVASLESGGGNNDAAALQHAARVALGSRRRAKLLVMISDGLPTECSVDSLRALVDHLGRRKGLLCAQVAVRPLEEVCFPHYVQVESDDLDLCVRRFGEIISTLARRALGR